MNNQPLHHSNSETSDVNYHEPSRAQLRKISHVALRSVEELGGHTEASSKSFEEVAIKTNSSEHQTPDIEEKAKSFIRRHGRQLSLFAKDSSLSFTPSKTGETFSFNAAKFEVIVPLSWFASEQYTEDELDFANHHELAHFIDMRKNPEAFLNNFDQIEKDAANLAKKYLHKYPDRASLDRVTGFFYQELHSLYNVLDDIYVNNVVFSRNHHFDYGDGRKSVETLYEKLGFEEADQTEQPLHRQMIFSLLRDEMLGQTHGKTITDKRVEAALSKKKIGKSIRDWVNFDLKPKQGALRDPADRYSIIRKLIQPEYINLLEVSLDEQEEKKQKSSESGESKDNESSTQDSNYQTGNDANNQESENDKDEGNAGKRSSDFDPFNNGSSEPKDILDHGKAAEEITKEILKSFKESNDIDKMSPEERIKYQNQKKMQEFDATHHISAEQRRENERIKSKIASARREMRKFWRGLIGKSIEYRQTTVPHQRKGRLNVDSYIDQYPELVEAERRGDLRKLEIYDRQGLERKIIDQPETIDITLLVDSSGSMGYGSKIDSARAAAALLMYSVKDLNKELNATRHKTHSKLRANTEVVVFGSSYDTVKSFERNQGNGSNEAEIITSISKISYELGRTCDDLPLGDIESSITADERVRIKSKKLKKIVFEITDGASSDPTATAARLRELASEGVLVVGFQIGDVSEEERSIFETIWNDDKTTDSPNKRGIYIGKNISELPNRLMSVLSESLKNIII